jgi:alpha-glucosidase
MEDTGFVQRVRLQGDPHAHPESVVVCGNARFTVLTERLLRLEWSPTGGFNDFATFAFPNRRVNPPAPFAAGEEDEQLRLETGALTLTYRRGSGAFTAGNLTITLHVNGEMRTWRPGQPDAGNLGGTRRSLDFTGGAVPLEPGLVSRDGWVLFDDSAGAVLQPDDGWVAARPLQSVQDWYFFGYGHAYADALAEYTRFGGAVPLVPRYALGVWWSRFWPYSAADLERLVDEFADQGVPLDVLVVDMDWHLPGYWTGYTWNDALFPDPAAFLDRMHARGLHVTLNLHPADGVRSHEAAYPEMAAALGLADTNGAPIPFHITDRRFAEQYFTRLHHPLEEQGVDFWWIDWQQGETSDIAGVDPLLWLNHLHFADARRRGQRPLLFSRWGGLGNLRYPLGFSGDTYGGWATLAALPRFTAVAANIGFGWWSHDIGGHFSMVDAEILTRWVQFGALSPCLRFHAVNHALAERRPWAFAPRALDAMRQALALRYALVPYLYTMARHAHERGVALCRPMYYAYSDHEAAYLARNQYQLGDDLLAAPITEPADPRTGLAVKDVWIPPGTWYCFDGGAAFAGPRWVRIAGELETMPLFARAGAIVPLARGALHLADVPNDWLDIRVFPGSDGTFRLYEDDGISEAYLRGEHEWTALTCESEGSGRRVLRIAPVGGHCPALPTQRGYRVTFVGVDQPERVVDGSGALLPWTFDGAERSAQVTLAARPKDEAVKVAVEWPVAADEAEGASASAGGTGTPPFAHVVAYSASDEAQRQLAHLILVPPHGPDQQPHACDAEVVWREEQFTSVTEVRQAVTGLRAETMLTAPLALDQALQPQHWSVEVRFAAGEEHVTTTASGPYINPPIQRWRLRYAGQETWSVAQAEAARRLTITEPFEVSLDAQVATEVEARAVVDVAESMSAWLDTWTNGKLSLEFDGKAVETSEPRREVAGLARAWPIWRYGPIRLEAGQHTISAQLTAPEAPASWGFGAVLVDESGAPVVRCAHVVEADS